MKPFLVTMSRFAVEWLVAREADRLTHVMLLDKERPAPYTLAVGHGPDKVHALLSLWETLLESDAVPEAIATSLSNTGVAPASHPGIRLTENVGSLRLRLIRDGRV